MSTLPLLLLYSPQQPVISLYCLLMPEQFHFSAVRDRQKPFSEASMTTVFYKEARRLWDLEDGRDSLTKIQAGMCLCESITLVLGPTFNRNDIFLFYVQQRSP